MQFKGLQLQWQRTQGLRHIIIQISPFSSVTVKSPSRASWSAVEEILENKSQWIHEQLQRKYEVEARHPKKEFVEDERFLYLGEELPLKIVPTTGRKTFFAKQGDNLQLHLPLSQWTSSQKLARSELQDRLRDYYKLSAIQHLQQRVKTWSEIMSLAPKKLSFREQKSRWGSCSSRGQISLNWKIIAAPLSVIDSVVVHELAHLRHMNHSKSFWDFVDLYFPDYPDSDKWLNNNPHSFLFLSDNVALEKLNNSEEPRGSFGRFT